MTLKAGDRIRIKPEWQDKGDDQFEWYVLEDEAGGRVAIAPRTTLPLGDPWSRVYVSMVEKIEENES